MGRAIASAKEVPVATSSNAATTSKAILVAREAMSSVERAIPKEASARNMDVLAARDFDTVV